MAREMKNSGVQWIGDIPKDWGVVPNKYVMHKIKEICPVYGGEDILSLSVRGVNVRDLDAGGKMPTTFNGYQRVHPGNLLMCLFDMDVTPCCIGRINNEGLTSPAYSQFVLHQGSNREYFYYYYLMIDNTKELVHLAKNLRHTITEDQLGNIKLPSPPLSEQKAIATFLDTKCAEIDGLLADLDAEVKTLAEYKKSLIAETVTRGLNPNAPMKQSGIPWADTIPAHWKVQKGKYTFTLLQRPVKEDDGVITCFRDGEVTLRSNRREEGFTMSTKEYGYQGIEPGDLVVHGMDGFAGSIGISDSRGKATPVLNVLDSEQNKRYLMYYLRNMAYGDVFLSLSTGIRVRSCDLGWKKLGEIRIVIPPLTEQKAIADFLDTKCAAIDQAITDKTTQIETLKAYKASLIYEYVTGKKQVAL